VTDLALPTPGDRHAKHLWWFAYLAIVSGGLFITAFARRRVAEPYLALSLALLLLLLTCWLIAPRVTLYATIFLTAVSDTITVWWFPFAKNLSSRESISFVADSLTVSPLEISLYVGVAVSCLRRYARTRTVFRRTPLTRPLLVFTGFVVFGFLRGLARGADLRIAVLEGRALIYIVLVFVIIANEFDNRRQFRYALCALLGGVVVQSLLSLEYAKGIDAAERETLDSLNEHGSALGHAMLFVAFVALLLFGIKRGPTKWVMVAGLVPTVWVFFIGQRRAGIAALVVAGVLVGVTLWWRRRAMFVAVVPVLAIAMAGYTVAFWNSASSVAFPAQAIKTIIAPQEASAEDQSSNLYRQIEANNVNLTIRTSPLLGIGFGQAFYRPIPQPEITAFVLSPFVPHNNVLWIWMKTGFAGFVAMFYLFGKAVLLGARRIRHDPMDIDFVVTLCGTAFVVMYLVYSYVDMSWDPRNTVFLGLAFAICAVGNEPANSTSSRS
jgi:O-antigen ligase